MIIVCLKWLFCLRNVDFFVPSKWYFHYIIAIAILVPYIIVVEDFEGTF